MSVWLPHAALIPTYWNRAWPVRLPLPIIPGVNASAHRFGGFGLTHHPLCQRQGRIASVDSGLGLIRKYVGANVPELTQLFP